jgi:putative DNA primase/helicase
MEDLQAAGHDTDARIFEKLLAQLDPVDFHSLAFPRATALREELQDLMPFLTNPDGSENDAHPEKRKRVKDIQKELDSMRLKEKHRLILTIEKLLEKAEANNWGLCKKDDFIYLYRGSHWNEVEKDRFELFLGKAAEKMGIERFDARYFLFMEKLFRQFIKTAILPTPEPTEEKVLINLKNGTFEIGKENNRLRPFDRSDFITYQLPFDYNPDADAPLFKAYLNKVLPDPERQRILAEYLGFVFMKNGTNGIKEEKVLLLYGGGANGKSVFFHVVNALLGRDNVSNYSLQSLTEEKGFYRAKIANKLLNYTSEISGKLETDLFKQLASGEPVEACLKYGQPFTMHHYAKMIFNCNELPKDVEQSNAYFRRFMIIPFDVTIPENEQDKELHSKIIRSELSGVFNWVLEGLERLLAQRKFSPCRAAEIAREDYQRNSDSVRMFLEDGEYQKSPDSFEPLKEVYSAYRTFCMEDGMPAVKKSNFRKRLETAGFTIDRIAQGNVVYMTKKQTFDSPY